MKDPQSRYITNQVPQCAEQTQLGEVLILFTANEIRIG